MVSLLSKDCELVCKGGLEVVNMYASCYGLCSVVVLQDELFLLVLS